MSTCVVSPLSTASSTPQQTSFLIHNERRSDGIQLPKEIAELKSTIFKFENTKELDENRARSVQVLDTAPKKSRRSRYSRLRKRFSTTSTVFAKSTIINPNFSQVNYCIAALLQARIFDDLFNADASTDYPAEFNIETSLPPELGGVCLDISVDVLELETENDEELREKILNLEVPTIDTIYRFIGTIFERAKYSVECNILAFIYVNRMTHNKNYALTMDSWRGFWVSAIILAQKVWDDRPVRTSSFADMIPNTTKDQMRFLELSGFRLLDFGTRVKPSTYARHYFELRNLYVEIVGKEASETWNVAPLSVAEGQRLEYRSSLPCMQYQYSTASTIVLQPPIETWTGKSISSGRSCFAANHSSSSSSIASNACNPVAAVDMMLLSPISQQSSVTTQQHTKMSSIPCSMQLVDARLSLTCVSNSSMNSNVTNSKRRVRGNSKTTEDIHPVSSSARYIIS